MPHPSTIYPTLLLVLLHFACPAAASQSDAALAAFLHRYHQLPKDDPNALKSLAKWCAQNDLPEQQIRLLIEALSLRPDDAETYPQLIAADATHYRPVDPNTSHELATLLGREFRLKHTNHFTLLSNTNDDDANSLAAVVEDAYALFYRESARIGLRPLPPPQRLVCILFQRHHQYRDYLLKHENTPPGWSSGHYSVKSNRIAFFHDRDNPAFDDINKQLAAIQRQIANLHSELDVSTRNARKIEIQQQLNDLRHSAADINRRLSIAGNLATASKIRHEATHQLLYNSGLLRPGKQYPFWINEGLPCSFELANPDGQAGPAVTNLYRLQTYRQIQSANLLLPLSKLVQHQPDDNEPIDRVAADYAQAWALVHYLWNTHPNALKHYLNQIHSTQDDPTALFRSCFGPDLPALQRQLHKYIDAL